MIRAFIQRHTTAGFRDAVKKLVWEWRIQWRHKSTLRRYRHDSKNDLKLNVACGSNIKQGWVNIDINAESDLTLDLREALPFASESVQIVYSEHFFEHLEYPGQALHFLRESLRVLRPGGVFSVGVPDTEWPLKSYVHGDHDYFQVVREKWHPDWCDTRMHNINYHFRQGNEHKYAYDFETLAKILDDAGFVDVVERPFDAALDDELRKFGTLYVEALKPGHD